MRALINYQGKDRWEVWAAESIVWTARRLRARETSLRINPPGDTWETTQATREALRGWGQIREYRSTNGGYLPIGISDHATAIQNRLEAIISAPRAIVE